MPVGDRQFLRITFPLRQNLRHRRIQVNDPRRSGNDPDHTGKAFRSTTQLLWPIRIPTISIRLPDDIALMNNVEGLIIFADAVLLHSIHLLLDRSSGCLRCVVDLSLTAHRKHDDHGQDKTTGNIFILSAVEVQRVNYFIDLIDRIIKNL